MMTIVPAATIHAQTWATQMPAVRAGHAAQQTPRTTLLAVGPAQAAREV